MSAQRGSNYSCDPFVLRHLALNGDEQVGVDRSDGADVLRHACDATHDSDLAVGLNAVWRNEVREYSDVPGVDGFLDEAADDLLVGRGRMSPAIVLTG